MPAPATAGIDIRNENRAASLRVRPSSSAMQIVDPDRDTPGSSASVCARPMISASVQVRPRHRLGAAVVLRPAIDEVHHDADADHRAADQIERPRVLFDVLLEQQADHDDRHGRERDLPREPTIRRAGAREVPRHRDQILREVRHDRGDRPELQHRGERGAAVLLADERRHDPQVRVRRDRDELGQPLHEPEERGEPQRTSRATLTRVETC